MNFKSFFPAFKLLFVLLFQSYFSVNAQDQRIADSLEWVYKSDKVEESSLIETLYAITYNQTNPDVRLSYANLLESKVDTLANPDWLMKINFQRGLANMEKGELETSLDSFFNSLRVAQKLKDQNWIGMIYIQIASVYEYSDNYSVAFSYIRKAITIFKELRLSNHPRATSNLATAVLTLGNQLMEVGKYDSALSNFEQSIEVYEQIEDTQGLAYALGSKGVLLAKNGDILAAEENIDRATKILKVYKDLEPIVYFNNHLSEAHITRGNYTEALGFLEESLKISLRSNYKTDIVETYGKLSELYEKLGNSAMALDNFKAHILYRDSLRNIESVQELANFRSEYEIAQKQSEVDILNLEKKQQQQIGFGLVLVLLLSTALGITQYRNAKLRKRTNHELTALNRTKDKFFSIISHDLRGPVSAFQGVSGIIRMYLKKQRYEKLEEMTDEIDSSVRSMSNLLDNLLNWAVQQQGQVPFNPEQLSIKEILHEVIETFEAAAQIKRIKLSYETTQEVSIWADKNTITTIMRNLVGNALKYSMENGEVKVTALADGRSCMIKVSDTGVGIPEDKLSTLFNSQNMISSTRGTAGEKGLGLGMQLVYEFLKMNNSTIEVESYKGKGTTFTINMPLDSHVPMTDSDSFD